MAIASNLPAERGLLGILINHNEALFDIGNIVLAEDFVEPANAELFNLLKDQIEGDRHVTGLTMMHDAQDVEIGEGITAREYIRKLEEEAPEPKFAKDMALAVADAALRRKMEALGEEIKQMAIAAPVSVSAGELRAKVEESVGALFSSVADLGLRKMVDVGDGVMERAKTVAEIGLDPGIAPVREMIGMLMPGRLYAIGGGPGSGKSTMAAQIAKSVAMDGKSVLIFSPEMEADEIIERELATMTGVSLDAIERLMLTTQEYESVWKANETLRHLPVYIDDQGSPSMSLIISRAIRKKRMGGVDLLIIDHMGYVADPGRGMQKHEAYDVNLIRLKALAKLLGIPVIALVQMTGEALKEMARWPHPRPTQAGLLYSGIVERHADAIMLLHRDEYYVGRSEPQRDEKHYMDWSARLLGGKGKAEAILTKRRGGVGFGRREMGFEPFRFTDAAPRMTRVDPNELPF